MSIRIRPAEVDVPDDDPFKNDLLDRKRPAEVLTRLVDSVEDSCVLTVDAAWGAGKTTFLKMWSQHLRKEGFPVVSFNAWETDHAEEPFVALASELTDGLKEACPKERFSDRIKEFEKVALRAMPAVIRVLTAGILDIQPLMEKEAGKFLSSFAESRWAKYQADQNSIETFRSKLKEIASELLESKGHPLVVVIDELDRCRPSYAVELIETVKHLFGVDHLIFVLALNRDQLAHSIKALYGSGFDAIGYLRRFFDIDFRLPEPDRTRYIDALLEGIEIPEIAQMTVQAFFGVSHLSLRHVGQAIHRLRIISASIPGEHDRSWYAPVAALVARTIDADMYSQFVQGLATDKQVVDSIFQRIGIKDLKFENTDRMHTFASFETIMAMGWSEMNDRDNPRTSNSQVDTPLLDYYRQLCDRASLDGHERSVEYARYVIEDSKNIRTRRFPGGLPVAFVEAVRRMELLVPFDRTT